MQFSVEKDEPFVIFQILREIARGKHGDGGTIDLSRGDPGYGFTPSVRGRLFASFVLFLDTVLNVTPENRFPRYTESDEQFIAALIERATRETYAKERAEELLSMLRKFLDAAKQAAREEGKDWTDFEVYRALFGYCAMSGGSYLLPEGQELTRVILAAWHRKEQGVDIHSSDIILTNGASAAIGSLFKALGEEGCGYLTANDTVAIASPVYAPYNSILRERNLRVLPFSIHPLTGKMDISRLRKAAVRGPERANDATGKPPKALFLIAPNNPTGFSLPDRELEQLAEIAREKNMLVITDEVYRSFFPGKNGMLALAPERTICISARSKIERATGLRLGEMLILP
ncbi:MAG: pyridoxal phosphate-dependent aminotransferase, partial [Patescibacteria group bacterium]